MQFELVKCNMLYGPEIPEMIREIGPGENGFQNNGYGLKDEEFRQYIMHNIDMSRGVGLAPGHVPQTLYWLYADGRPVGYAKLREYLNERLRFIGGHIGYCIRPTERRKGYGKQLLGEMLKEAGKLNIPNALVTCLEENKGSRGVIESNGGRLADITDGECHYWIGLDIAEGVREAHPDDFQEMLELWERTPGVGITKEDTEENIIKFLSRNKGLSFVYKADSRIVGTSLCGHDGRRGYIYHTAVAQDYRGKGIGGMLVEKNLEKLRTEGIAKCRIFVFKSNEEGNAFWKRSGWETRDDLTTYSKDIYSKDV
ncbi:MAG TPA: GNAT family N-acetyltransferase [Clostridia bacterium]|nr:GNAT family N-acetyltransferase [Clostridia bacterium]